MYVENKEDVQKIDMLYRCAGIIYFISTGIFRFCF